MAEKNIVNNGTLPKTHVRPRPHYRNKKKNVAAKSTENIPQTQSSTTTIQTKHYNENTKSKNLNEGSEKEEGSHQRQLSPLPAPKINAQTSKLLQKNFINILSKKSSRNPSARFQCDLCHYHCDSLSVVHKHVRGSRHIESIQNKYEEITIEHLPDPISKHSNFLTNYVLHIFNKYGMDEHDICIRENIALTLDKIVKTIYPECAVLLYGSSASKLGLKDSNVNLDLFVQSNHVIVMKNIGNIIAEQVDIYKDVRKNFSDDMPSIEFIDKISNLKCILCINTENALDTSRLLGLYETKDPRFRPLAVAFRVWAKECQLSDPSLGTWSPYAFNLMVIYFLQQLEDPVLPIIPLSIIENLDKNKVQPKEIEGDEEWKTDNFMTFGELWARLFKLYAVTLKQERVVCIKQLEPLTLSTKKWSHKGIGIEDPFHPRLNVSRTLHPSVVSYAKSCFQKSYKYFGIPQTVTGPIFYQITTFADDFKNININNIIESHHYFSKNPIPDRNIDLKDIRISPADAQTLMDCFRYQYLYYTFEKKNFVQELLPDVCTVCLEEGHTRSYCPEELEPLTELGELTTVFKGYLNNLCEVITKQYEPNLNELKEREDIVKEIEDFITEFWPNAKLELFGSSCNGFGIHSSDIDMCLLVDIKNLDLEGINLIKHLAEKLKNFTKISDIIPIITAKVPILKMKHVQTKKDCDLSISNRFGQRNTYLLKVYSEIDPRAKTLGFLMKKLAKFCDIADASKGSLSSYAYILMVIYFLQQVNPPVLPVLQEIYVNENDKNEKSHEIDGYNTYFYDDIKNLAKIWPDYRKNTTPVGELWVQFLRFYTEEFDFKNTVISIRQHAILTRFEKLWMPRSMAIEDPFNLSHNLGARISWKMNLFILKVLRNARLHFGTSVSIINKPLEEYFFDLSKLVTTNFPNERCCLICKQSTHIRKDCPQRRHGDRNNRQSANPNHRQQNSNLTEHPPIPPQQHVQVPLQQIPHQHPVHFDRNHQQQQHWLGRQFPPPGHYVTSEMPPMPGPPPFMQQVNMNRNYEGPPTIRHWPLEKLEDREATLQRCKELMSQLPRQTYYNNNIRNPQTFKPTISLPLQDARRPRIEKRVVDSHIFQ